MRTACRAATERIQPRRAAEPPRSLPSFHYGDGEMRYVNLGNTGLRVSRICLGMMSFGHVRGAAVGAARVGG